MKNVSNIENYSDDISNAELVKKSQFGDKSAFEQLVFRHQDLVFSLAYKLTGNREMANDVAQESFIRAWKAIEKFRGDSTFSTWIYRITVNTAWTLRKKAKNVLKSVLGLDPAEATPTPKRESPVVSTEPSVVRTESPLPPAVSEDLPESEAPANVVDENQGEESNLEDSAQETSADSLAEGLELTLENVQEILDDYVRPGLQSDGGDITLIKIEDSNIYVQLVGACSTCPSSIMTMKMGVEALLREEFPSLNELIDITSEQQTDA